MSNIEHREGRPDPALLAGRNDIAAHLGVEPNTVTVWQIRHDDFPQPLAVIGGRVKVWWLPEVEDWYQSRPSNQARA